MSVQCVQHPAVSLALGHGLDLPQQAARARAAWVAGRQGRAPLLLVALIWGRRCPNPVHTLGVLLDELFADYACTPEGWSEAQAARQVLAALNLKLFRARREGTAIAQLDVGLLLLCGDQGQFLQAGAIGLLRSREAGLQVLAGREEQSLGGQAELALVQHGLSLDAGETLLLAPQPLFEVADLDAWRGQCGASAPLAAEQLLEPWLQAPGAAVLLRPGATDQAPPVAPAQHWPAVAAAEVGMQVDGWTLLERCRYGPPGRLFRAVAADGRGALLWLADAAADEAFWQREWVLRRSPVRSLPQVLSAREVRRHAFLLFALPGAGARSLEDWCAARGALPAVEALALLVQLLAAVRALQRRGMQGLWLSPRQILRDERGQLLLLPEQAAILPGVTLQALDAEAVPLAPELRRGEAVDGRADQFALAALLYWMLGGRWPEVALPGAPALSHYAPLGERLGDLPAGWDGVLARALAPLPAMRYEALSELQQALEQPLQRRPAPRAGAWLCALWQRWWRRG
ncbi:protein kinase [Pseudomonas sp. UL073]|uniref:Protein kinase n=1 Tax=Zestomonas insulae TaxID=2809017 RepID=A0ABS2ILS4_9GAMM|nr:protein kinase [Pseudomonas insulae]MBM7062838.1 protein kinase [Pseudomonas insulae]